MESQGLDVLQLLGIFRRQLRLILLVAGTSVGLTLVILLTLKPIYAASALVLVDPSHKNLLAASDAPAAPADGPRVDSEAALVTSPATLREVIKDADLLNEPEFGSRAGWFDAVLRALQAEPPASAAGDAQTALDGLVRAVTATRVGTTYLIDVSAGAHSAALSATLANAVARRYIDEQRQAKVDAVLASRDIVASQLASANASVVAAEDAIDAFMMANVASIAPKIVGADIPQIRDRLRQLEVDQETQSNRANALAHAIASANWHDLTTSLQSETTTSLYQQRQSLASDLANKQGPEAAGLREQLAQLDARIESDGKTELTNLQDAVTSGASEIADLKTQLRSLAVTGGMPALLVTNLYALQQNAQLARSQYQSLLSRQQQLVVEATLQLADSRLVSPALPPSSPVWPNWHLSLTLGSLAGFALAVGSALLRDSFVGGFTSLDHLEAVLGTPALASILWRRKSRHHLDAFSIADLMRLAPLSTYAESIRKLQVGVTHALRRVHERTSSAARGGVVLVSSVAPGDGKTTIALSLARAFAASGHSTLLIDGDLRLPRLHQHLGIEPAAGLGELLQGSGAGPKLPEILITDPMADLRVIVGANRSDSPTDRLAAGKAFAALLQASRRHFEIIIVDTPPLDPVVDALYLAEFADVVVFVLRWAKTSQPAAKAAITALREAMPTGSEIVSVINQQRTSPPQSDYDREYQG